MVVGVETAGLVLAAVPLIIEGLKTYQKGIRSAKRSITYDVSLRKLVRRIEGQKIFFEDNLQRLLSCALAYSGHHIELEDDYWTRFSSPGVVNQAVQNYLGMKRQQYFHTLLAEFESYFLKMGNVLDRVQISGKKQISRNHLTLSDLYSSAQKQEFKGNAVLKRVQYLIKEPDIISLLGELDDLNLEMDRLLTNADAMAQHKTIRESQIVAEEHRAKELASLVDRIRAYADRLFNSLFLVLMTHCHTIHDVALFLDTPHVPTSADTHAQSSFEFRMMICGKPQDVTGDLSWRRTNVFVYDDESSSTVPGISAPARPPSIRTSIAQAIQATPSGQGTLYIAPNGIEDLCHAATRADRLGNCLRLVLRDGTSLVSDNECNPHSDQGLRSTINLEKFISTNRMGPAQKVKLALKLAISLLQLKNSKWLPSSISARVIYFRETVHTGNGGAIELDEPLIIRSFDGESPGASMEHESRQTLTELGILLMEIWNGETFAAFAKKHHCGHDVRPLERHTIAMNWYEQTWQQMTNNYGGVVKTCMSFPCDQSQGLHSWEDFDLRTSICAKVISPLYQDRLAFP